MTARSVLLALCVVGVAAGVWAQTTQPAGDETGSVGVVIGKDVYVRSGASTTQYYPCTKVHSPQPVTVVDKRDSWYVILPPPGTYGVISKDYVRLDADGKTGAVTTDKVWVRSGGDLCDWSNIKNFWSVQVSLNTGDKVEVTGQGGDYYKIVPPKGARYYISQSYVQLEGAAPPVAKTGKEVPAEAATRAGVEGPTTRRVASLPPATDKELIAAFDRAEKALKAEFNKPVNERHFSEILAMYQDLKPAPGSPWKKVIDNRILVVQAAIEEVGARQDAERINQQVSANEQELVAARKRISAEVPTTAPLTAFVAQGVLTPSEIFTGNAAVPKRYTTRDPMTQRITAYVQCTSKAVDLDQYVGKLVGIQGSTKFDRDLGLDIVEAQEVKVLSDKVEIPAPPRPVAAPVVEPPRKPVIISPVVTPPPKALESPAKVEPVAPAAKTVAPKPAAVDAAPEPKTQPAPVPAPKPTTAPAVAPATKPAPTPAEVETGPIMEGEPAVPALKVVQPKPAPVLKATPEKSPTTIPASPAGLPMVDPTTRPANPVQESEYN